MDTLLLPTKLQIPPQAQHGLYRSRLVNALERGIPHRKLVLISTPAGYGKTTLLAQWARASHFPIAWLSVNAEDNDHDRFLRYLLAAWAKVQPGVKESPLGLLLSGMSPNSEAVLSAFINVANDTPDHVAFVLDDYHLIKDSSIHRVLTYLLDHLPPTLHFALATRADPPLPLARYRARHELLELRAEDLQFVQEETAEVLKRLMGFNLMPDDVAVVQTQLEGWVAGLQLVALTLKRRLSGGDKVVITGKHRFIADYLNEDVLAPLSFTMRQFLLQTSILDQLCSELCNAVTGKDDGQEMLELLERENLFLMPLDDSREWFRYHQLFADFLREELNRRHPADAATLHRRAARWYLAHDLPEQAFHHAVSGEDVEFVTEIANRYVFAKVVGGEISIVQRWLASLPEPWYVDSPELGLAQATMLLFTGQFDACAHYLDEIERLAMAVREEILARVTAMRCFIACFQNDLARAEVFAQKALTDLPENDDLGFRHGIYGALGDSYRRNGRWEESKACYLKVLDLPAIPSFRLRSVHLFGALADLALRQGQLRQAAAYWRKALAITQDEATWGRLPLPVIGWVFMRMGEILYEWNDLSEASNYLSRGLERAQLGGDVRAMIAGHVMVGRLHLAKGNIAAAGECLERVRPLVEQAPFPDWIGRFERFQLECWLAQDRLRTAVNWGDAILKDGKGARWRDSEEAQLALTRVLIFKGGVPALERALALLMRVLAVAESEGRVGVQIEALALQALAYSRGVEPARGKVSLERALRLAEPEGYVRLFADFGVPMVYLLQEARSRGVLSEYVGTLLAACGDLSQAPPGKAPLLEPLTPREQEILVLMAAGLSNREIAAALVVSPETVKKHTGSIYGKLGVSNRTEAAARARALDLLA